MYHNQTGTSLLSTTLLVHRVERTWDDWIQFQPPGSRVSEGSSENNKISNSLDSRLHRLGMTHYISTGDRKSKACDYMISNASPWPRNSQDMDVPGAS